MVNKEKRAEFRVLFLITTPKIADKASKLFYEGRIPIQYRFRGKGTASNEIMSMLGLVSTEKSVLISFLPRKFAGEMLKKLQKILYLGSPDSGIAFSVPLTGGNSRVLELIDSLDEMETNLMEEGRGTGMIETKYSMIMVIVNQGFSEAVMDAAKPAGATGGTVFHCRRIGSEEAMKFWGISIQQEREIILILSTQEAKKEIMSAIGKNCGMRSEAHGIVLSLPVDDVVGLD